MEQKKVMVVNDTVPYLPQEIVVNILIRLPVKSLIRFQCVGKDWKNLFRTASFIAEHLHYSAQQNPYLLVDCFNAVYGSTDHCHLQLMTGEKQVLEFQNPPIIDSLVTSRRIVFSSNGLLCVTVIYNSQRSFWLWNPAIRDIRQVPKSLNNHKTEKFSVGFGFSQIVNDYKIVQLFRIDQLVNQVEVYSLQKGLWRKVEFGHLETVISISHSGFTFNGAIFWFGLKKELESGPLELIVKFDIATEVFSLLLFPPLALLSGPNSLTTYDNKLAMLSPVPAENSESCLIDLWVMEESKNTPKEGRSWTKIYRSRPYPCWLHPMTIWRNEIVCIVDAFSKWVIQEVVGNNEARAILYHLTTKEFNTCAIPGCFIASGVLDYVESLVPIGNVFIEEP